jgi:CubicO group peptidase (beta-lactamase class C family)
MKRLLKKVIVSGMSLLSFLAHSVERSPLAKDSARQHRVDVEHHLLYQTTIKGAPDSGMSLEDQMAQLHVPGVSIAVIHEGHIEWTAAYGVVRLKGPHVTADTLFNAASMSKPLTAMAVMKLVQDGRIDLDADANSYLKSWKIPDNEFTKDHRVTVRELLNHTSGIGMHSGELDDPDKGLPTVLQMLNGEKPATTGPVRVEAVPGSKYAYANGGYLILQLLVTEVTGEPFAPYMQETLLRPLGMTHSTFEAPLSPTHAALAATGYLEDGTSGTAPDHFVKPNLAAGGLWTTAPDYARLVIELQKEYAGRSDRILKQSTVRTMMTPGLGPSDKMKWGLGVHVGGSSSNPFFEHGGSGVFQSDMVGYPSGDGIVVLTNGGGGGPLCDEIVRSAAQVYGWPDFHPAEHTLARVSPSQYDNLIGTYDFIKVTRDGDDLMAEVPIGTRKQKLFPESATRYFLRDVPTTIVFDLNNEMKATGLEFITTVVHWHRDKAR